MIVVFILMWLVTVQVASPQRLLEDATQSSETGVAILNKAIQEFLTLHEVASIKELSRKRPPHPSSAGPSPAASAKTTVKSHNKPLDLCDTYNISNHLLCCKSDHYRILPDCVLKPSNVAIPFDASPSSPSSSSSKLISYSATTTLHEGIYALPTIRFTGKVVKKNIQIPMQIVAMERFNRSKCSAYFNGTLHIVGRHIPNNLYHFLNDNLFPLMGQLLMDIYYAPDFLQLPRAHLTNLAPAQERMLTIDEVPHNELLKSLLSEEVDWKSEQHNLCVRRVVFGVGSRLMYHHLLRRMRHEVGDLIHLYAKHYYCHHAAKSSPSRGDHFSRICSGTAKKTTSSKLKLVIYSRGNTGKRRSIANEDLLVNRLQQLDNFDVTYVHDYPKQSAQQDKTKPDHNPQEVLLDRLEAVLDADIVIGLHGAALANVIFAPRNTLLIELKSTYGYSLDLFAVMSESRYGDFAQVDLKGNPRDKLSMDPGIVDRIVAIIQEARPSSNQQTKQSKAWRDSSIRQFGSKLDLLVTNEAFNKGTAHHNLSNPIDSDIFGPSLVSSMHQQCATMTISDYWKAINTDYVQLKYCQGCPRNPS